MDPIRAVQCRLKFRSESSKSGVRLQSGSGRSAITSLFYKFRSLFTMIVKTGGRSEKSIIAEIKFVGRVSQTITVGRNQKRCPLDEDRAKFMAFGLYKSAAKSAKRIARSILPDLSRKLLAVTYLESSQTLRMRSYGLS